MPCTDPPLVIIQARTNSRRLPGKALLDFRGLPLVILAAKRAGSCGARITIATSDNPSDDALAACAQAHGINLVRGPLDNVLARFVLAIGSEPDTAPVVRLTADNLLPDGDLIAEVLHAFEDAALDYITTGDGDASGLPYGCALEVTRARHLRDAAANAWSPHDQEHVTPFIRQRFGTTSFTRHAALRAGHLRATIDCLDDYNALYHATPIDADLTCLPWRSWVEHLRAADTAPRGKYPVRDLVLGTAQLGLPYGIARSTSPDVHESTRMLQHAITEGVSHIDTARAYGTSEALIGRLWRRGWDGRAKIVTKLSPLDHVAPDTSTSELRAQVDNSLLQSCVALGVTRLDSVLLHRAAHLDMWGGQVFDILSQWQADGRIGALGVSVQSPEDLSRALRHDAVAHVQLPCNIMDHRWHAVGDELRRARSQRKLTVHVRSSLLQGLLTTDDKVLWRRAHVDDPRPVYDWLAHQAAALGQESVTALCLGWARGLDWVDGVVVGCDSLDQLRDTIRLFNQPALTQDQIDMVNGTRPQLDPRSLDPAKWNAG